MNTFDKYWWVWYHPQFNIGNGVTQIEITPHMVNPDNDCIEKDTSKNNKLQWWIELMYDSIVDIDDNGKYKWGAVHDWRLDCGGDTIDEAIDNLYKNTLSTYGDYEEK